MFTTSCLFLRAWNLITKRLGSRRREPRTLRKRALSSRKLRYANSTSYSARPWSGARHPNACLRELSSSCRSFVRAWHPWRIGSRGGRESRPKVERSARAENEPAYKITIPLPFLPPGSTFAPRQPPSLSRERLYLFNRDSNNRWLRRKGSRTIADQRNHTYIGFEILLVSVNDAFEAQK